MRAQSEFPMRMLSAFTDALIKAFVRLRFRYDIFISYPRADATAYAVGLRDDLKKLDYECFLDQDEAPPGASLSRTLRRALDRSAVLVIVGSHGAAASHYVTEEIAHFAASGRAVVPINIGSVRHARWGAYQASDQIWIDETDAALAAGQPSLGVITAVEKRFRYTRRNVRVRTQVAAAGAAFVIGAVSASYLLQREVRSANAARQQAQEQQKAAEAATGAAQESRAEALRQQDQAEKNRRAAEQATTEADRQRVEAEAAAARAKEQQIVAESRSLAARAVQTIVNNSTEALTLGLQAWRTSRTTEAHLAVAAAIPRVLKELDGHTGSVDSAAFSPDGRRVVTASRDGTARVWDVATGGTLSILGEPDRSAGRAVLSLSHDGRRIVTAGGETARVWDVAGGQALAVLRGHTGVVKSASFSPDDRLILTISDDARARVWNAATGESLITADVNAEVIMSAEFSPTGDRVVSAGDGGVQIWEPEPGRPLPTLSLGTSSSYATFTPDGERIVSLEGNEARMWEPATGRPVRTFRGHIGAVRHVAFSRDGQRMVTASADRTAIVWNPQTGARLATLRAHVDEVTGAEFSADGRWILTASTDRTARVWNAQTGDLLATLQNHSGAVTEARFSATGLIVTASGETTARIWTTTTGEMFATMRGDGESLSHAAFSRDGRQIVAASGDGLAGIWSADRGERLVTLPAPKGTFRDASFSIDGRRILSAGRDGASIWSATTGKKISSLASHDPIDHVIQSPDGRRLATWSDREGTPTRVWDAATGDAVAVFDDQQLSWNSSPFSPDSERIITVSHGAATVWNLAKRQQEFRLTSPSGPIWRATFSADGERIATTGYQFVTLWDAATGRSRNVVATGTRERLERVVFSRDLNQIVTGNFGSAKVWDATRSEIRTQLSGHDGEIYGVSFSPDEKRILTFAGDHTARVWDAATGQCEVVIGDATGRLTNAMFSPDGQHILTADSDGTIRLFRVLHLPEIATILRPLRID